MIRAKILELIAELKEIPTTQITGESTLEELGVDSLDWAEFLFEIEDRLGIAVPESSFTDMTKLDDVVATIERIVAERGAGGGDDMGGLALGGAEAEA